MFLLGNFLILFGIFALTFGASTLPHIVTVNTNGRLECGGTVLSANSVLIPGYCGDEILLRNVKIRNENTPPNESGDIYRVSGIVLNPIFLDLSWSGGIYDQDRMLIKLDRPITTAGAMYDPAAPEPAPGTVCTTYKRSYENINYNVEQYWVNVIYHTVTVLAPDVCQSYDKKLNITDKICVMGSDPVGPKECRPEDGAPLVCNGAIVGITACDVQCYVIGNGPCFFKKISYLDDYVFQ